MSAAQLHCPCVLLQLQRRCATACSAVISCNPLEFHLRKDEIVHIGAVDTREGVVVQEPRGRSTTLTDA